MHTADRITVHSRSSIKRRNNDALNNSANQSIMDRPRRQPIKQRPYIKQLMRQPIRKHPPTQPIKYPNEQTTIKPSCDTMQTKTITARRLLILVFIPSGPRTGKTGDRKSRYIAASASAWWTDDKFRSSATELQHHRNELYEAGAAYYGSASCAALLRARTTNFSFIFGHHLYFPAEVTRGFTHLWRR